MPNPHMHYADASSPTTTAGTPLADVPQIPLTSRGTPTEAGWPNKGRLHIDSIHVGYLADGLAVLDVDNKNGKRGSRELKAIFRSLGLQPKISTFATATPSGGNHIFWQDPRIGLTNTVDAFGHVGLDFRVGRNGYVRDFPSPGYRILNKRPIEPMPGKLIDYFGNKIAERRARLAARSTGLGGVVRHTINGLEYAVYNAPIGQRNATLFWAASRVAEMPAARHRSALRAMRRAAFDIGLGHDEVEKTIASAFGGAA
ncbi:bifunctional DNA primase/polymerase [Zafaria sp. Z1313]|uniref:bifunctional DNA primase/polymerase n=1 Tax=Zafaria sp. Z1313 TaxID=3423202 RepID=UPI003D3032C4